MAKIHRHETNSISAPPPSGPITNAMPVHAVHDPIAAPALVTGERGRDQRQAAWYEQRAGDALERPCCDEKLRGRGDRAQRRGHAEADQPGDEDPAAPEVVTERPADQDQRTEREQVGLDDPLLGRQAGVQVLADGRERDVDHGPVEEDDGRAEDGGYEGRALATRGRLHRPRIAGAVASVLRRAPDRPDGARGHHDGACDAPGCGGRRAVEALPPSAPPVPHAQGARAPPAPVARVRHACGRSTT